MSKGTYMMATKAIHRTGDISRDEPDLCIVFSETTTDYIGNWVTGLGFIHVEFPKATTRKLTQAEAKYYHGLHIAIGDMVFPSIEIAPREVELC